MNDCDSDAEFEVRLNTIEKADIYLSVSEFAGSKQNVLWQLVKWLDQAKMRVVSDLPGMLRDDSFIAEIMESCNGLVAVLPYLENSPCATAPDIIRDINIAVSLDIPVFLIKDPRVNMEVCSSPDGRKLQPNAQANELSLALQSCSLFGPFDCDEQTGRLQPEMIEKLQDYIYHVLAQPRKFQPYAFLAVRLQRDFERARRAMISAVENAVGIPCLWFDDNRHTTNVQGVRERTRLLIKRASFIIADLTYGPENPANDSPNRAHEIGMAIAYRRPVVLCCQDPRRTPYFSAGDMQMIFWKDEENLHEELTDRLRTSDGIIVRRVYNRELAGRETCYEPHITEAPFVTAGSSRYIAPTSYPLSSGESWFVAIGFGMIALALSLISHQVLDYYKLLDFGAILAGVLAFVFSSNLSRSINQVIARVRFFRWAVPLAGIILLLIWAMIRPYQIPTEYSNLQNAASRFSEPREGE